MIFSGSKLAAQPSLRYVIEHDLRSAFGELSPRMVVVLKTIWYRLPEGARIERIARELNVHRTTLLRWLRSDLGISPKQVVLRLRLSLATRLVLETELPLTKVALQAGYGTYQSMARHFRRSLGASPGEIRQRHGKIPCAQGIPTVNWNVSSVSSENASF